MAARAARRLPLDESAWRHAGATEESRDMAGRVAGGGLRVRVLDRPRSLRLRASPSLGNVKRDVIWEIFCAMLSSPSVWNLLSATDCEINCHEK